jgi:hypothetical protein
MKPRYGELFASAFAIWRGDADLLQRVAAVFFFLPAFAFLLFVPSLNLVGLSEDQARTALAAWLSDNAVWGLGLLLIQSFGSTAMLVLLGSERPVPGKALLTALRLFPALLLAWLATLLMMLAIVIALSPLIVVAPQFATAATLVPLLYLGARTFLTGPMVVMERGRGPIGALIEGIRRTKGNGGRLLLVMLTVNGGYYLLASLVQALLLGTAGKSEAAGIALDALLAAIGAVGGLALMLLQVAAYRALQPGKGAS